MATQREEAPAEEEIAPSRVPRPVDGGIDYVESLGRFVDNLMGDARAIRAAERHLAPLTLRADEMPDDPEPSEPPPPVPDATEVITRGDSPEGEAR